MTGWDPSTCLDRGECDACIANGEAVAAEIASWFYCHGCHESFPLEDEEGGEGLCGSCFEGCACEWEHGCAGTGIRQCHWCGGDQCICRCGGSRECTGCEDCDDTGPTDAMGSYDSDYSDE